VSASELLSPQGAYCNGAANWSTCAAGLTQLANESLLELAKLVDDLRHPARTAKWAIAT
jgi:hypothetical protein